MWATFRTKDKKNQWNLCNPGKVGLTQRGKRGKAQQPAERRQKKGFRVNGAHRDSAAGLYEAVVASLLQAGLHRNGFRARRKSPHLQEVQAAG